MTKLPEAEKVDRFVRQLEMRRSGGIALLALAAFVWSILTTFGTQPSFLNHAANNLADHLVELLRFFRFGIVEPVVHHLLRDVSHLDELLDDGVPEVLACIVPGITPRIVWKTALQKKLRQLVNQILEVQAVQQRAVP